MDLERVYIKDVETQKKYRDTKKQKWSYYTEQEMLEQYPEGDFKVLGDFSVKYANNLKITKKIIGKNGFQAYVKNYGGNSPKGYYLIGYIPVQQTNSYVRILGRKKGKLLGSLILLTLLCTIFLGGLWLGNSKRPVDTPVKIASSKLKNDNPNNISVPGIEAMYLKAGQTRVKQALLNIKGNAYDLTYTIALKETGEVLYTSTAIRPGYGVKQFDINRTFKKGTYPVTITVESSAKQDRKQKDKDKQVAYNAGRLNSTLIVQ